MPTKQADKTSESTASRPSKPAFKKTGSRKRSARSKSAGPLVGVAKRIGSMLGAAAVRTGIARTGARGPTRRATEP